MCNASGLIQCVTNGTNSVDGSWSEWTDYSECSSTCVDHAGMQVRRRMCNSPLPACSGRSCEGDSYEAVACNRNTSCPVHGSWCSWTSWSECSAECHGGRRNRTRQCACPAQSENGLPCPDSSIEVEQCHSQPCPVDCSVDEWSPWSECSSSCGVGERSRGRSIRPALFGGKNCSAYDQMTPAQLTEMCDTSETCSGSCNETDGTGWKCQHPCPSTCAQVTNHSLCLPTSLSCQWGCYCDEGYVLDKGRCISIQECSCSAEVIGVHGDVITVYIDAGSYYRDDCVTCICLDGKANCTNHKCIRFAPWSDWSSWTSCPDCAQPTAAFNQWRYRQCQSSASEDGLIVFVCNDGETASSESRPCSIPECQETCAYSPWSDWEPCSRPCNADMQRRFRNATNIAKCERETLLSDMRPCTIPEDCPESECLNKSMVLADCFTACSRTCISLSDNSAASCLRTSGGLCSNVCACPEGFYALKGDCVPAAQCPCSATLAQPGRLPDSVIVMPGDTVDIDCNTCVCHSGRLTCTNHTCPSWTQWGPWSLCNASCGSSTRNRQRTCLNGSTDVVSGADGCQGQSEDEQPCGIIHCPAPCAVTSWTAWTECSAKCDTGIRLRFRNASQPSEHRGECASLEEREYCNMLPCADACKKGLVYSKCATKCVQTCEDLNNGRTCNESSSCQAGCVCPPGQVVSGEECIPAESCPCSLVNDLNGITPPKDFRGQPQHTFPPGYVLTKQCNNCTCTYGRFVCQNKKCTADCIMGNYTLSPVCSSSCGSGVKLAYASVVVYPKFGGNECPARIRAWDVCYPHDCPCVDPDTVWSNFTGCEKTCTNFLSPPKAISTACTARSEGCICRQGLVRHLNGSCVAPEACPCYSDDQQAHEVGSQWQSPGDACTICQCQYGGTAQCERICSIPVCAELEQLDYSRSACCPVCKPTKDLARSCQLYSRLAVLTDRATGCRSTRAINTTWCQGACPDSTDRAVLDFTPAGALTAPACKCCRGTAGPLSFASVLCPDGRSTVARYTKLISCSCMGCN